MKKIIAYALLAGSMALAVPALTRTAEAAPAAPFGVAVPGTGVQDVAMRRKRMMRRHMMRRRMMSSRAARMRDSGNARNPSRPVMQQNQGMTSGGPRY